MVLAATTAEKFGKYHSFLEQKFQREKSSKDQGVFPLRALA